jgi:hypothetical protein
MFMMIKIIARSFQKRLFGCLAVLPLFVCAIESQTTAQSYDIVIYGGTSAGVIAAVQAARMNQSAVLIESGSHLGGLTSGGLGQTDIGNKKAIGGLSREFYQRVYRHYSKEDAWIYQKRKEFRFGAKDWDEEKAWWQFEPHVAESIFVEMISEEKVPVFYNERLDLLNGVEKHGDKISSIRMESGKVFSGKIYIDASYEGDLMAQAGVSFTVGRESNETYRETLNGVQTKNAIYHQLKDSVDPYIKKGNPESGLLPGIDPFGPGKEGSGDQKLQAYCFRMCLTDAPGNRIPFEKPADYDPLQFELLLRNFEAGADVVPWLAKDMPNRKTDTNNKRGVSTDYIGQNYHWPEADYKTREKIFLSHLHYQKGLMWTLANHPRVPQEIRNTVSHWGLPKDEFVNSDHWPHQLYIREARRMIGEYVMTEQNCRSNRIAPQSIGLAAYTMDSHHVQRYVDAKGQVKNEGDVQVGGFLPYPISYRSIIPKVEECTNLLVPVCLSASHIAFGSIRMEPVFMVLGQSAAIASSIAIKNNQPLQNIDYKKFREHLKSANQILSYHETVLKGRFLTEWWLIGPFDNEDRKGFSAIYPPEKEYNPQKTYKGRDNIQVVWQHYNEEKSEYINLANIFKPSDVGVGYARCIIEVPKDTTLKIGIGSNDGVRLWVNKSLVLDKPDERTAVPNADIRTVPFRKGKNTVLLKIDQVGGGWGFYFSVIEEEDPKE